MDRHDSEVEWSLDSWADCAVHCAGFLLLSLLAYQVLRPMLTRRTTTHPAQSEQVERAREMLERVVAGETPPPRSGSQDCPICLAPTSLAVETNCAHLFCGRCFAAYCNFGAGGGVTCPVCRQSVCVIIPCFTPDERTSADDETRRVVSEVEKFNRLYAGLPRSWRERISDAPMLARHMWRELTSFDGALIFARIRVLVLFLSALLYFFSPLDIIPEAVFGFLGLVDDLFVFSALALYACALYRQMWQHATHW